MKDFGDNMFITKMNIKKKDNCNDGPSYPYIIIIYLIFLELKNKAVRLIRHSLPRGIHLIFSALLRNLSKCLLVCCSIVPKAYRGLSNYSYYWFTKSEFDAHHIMISLNKIMRSIVVKWCVVQRSIYSTKGFPFILECGENHCLFLPHSSNIYIRPQFLNISFLYT